MELGRARTVPLTELHDDRIERAGVRLLLKRDDLLHPLLPGNKYRKLRHNLTRAGELGHETLLTYGGAYSNHIRAVAAAGAEFGFRTIGVIRGEEHLPLNDTLEFATGCGMHLVYLDRTSYRAKDAPEEIEALRRRFGDFYRLPEGGSNELAVLGCAELPAEIDVPFDVICCPVGTGGTLAGIAAGLPAGRRALGFSVLKGGQFLAETVTHLQQAAYGTAAVGTTSAGTTSAGMPANWKINYGFHAGGYAKRNADLDAFIADFARRHGMVLEWVYVAKMLWGIVTLAERGEFPPGTTIVAVITAPMIPGA